VLTTATGDGARLVARLGYASPADAVDDPRGVTVRCTPWRVTLMQRLELAAGDAAVVYRKVRQGGVAAAEAEWKWLRELPRLGVAVAAPAFFARAGERTVVATFAAAGRPLPALLGEAGRGPAMAYACEVVAGAVRRLHAAGLVYRDLYWNHLFAESLESAAPPIFVDVERVLRPRLRWRRWVVKDLAGLVASWPFRGDDRFAEAFVRACHGADAELGRRVRRKAEAISRHTPKYGA